MALWNLGQRCRDDFRFRMVGLQLVQVRLRRHAHAEVDFGEFALERREEREPAGIRHIALAQTHAREVRTLRDGSQCLLGDARLAHLANGETRQPRMPGKKPDARPRGLRMSDRETAQRFDFRALLHAFVRKAETHLDVPELRVRERIKAAAVILHSARVFAQKAIVVHADDAQLGQSLEGAQRAVAQPIAIAGDGQHMTGLVMRDSEGEGFLLFYLNRHRGDVALRHAEADEGVRSASSRPPRL